METPWGALPVSDAHVHFFSHRFFAALAEQKNQPAASLAPLLGWQLPAEDPLELATTWVRELDRHGLSKAVLIASIPSDADSVIAAVRRFPERFYGYLMVNPATPDVVTQVGRGLASGCIHGFCFFPAMHCYSMHDDRVARLVDLAAGKPGTIVFVHCGVLSVGVRKKLGLPSLFDMRFSNPIDLHAIALRYPQVRFVIPHFGAGYFREALMLCDLCPNVYLDTSSSNSWMRYEEAHLDLRAVFRRALDVAGPKRLLFGTDSSFFPRGWNSAVYDAQTKALYEIGVTGETAALILHDNLGHLFS
jgi:predicted TIM-barrel fold metal-dependent hydrolase